MANPLPHPPRTTSRLARTLRSLAGDTSAISMVEFALCLPFLVGLGMTGMEIAHMASVNMQVSQIALSVADNASRLGQSDNSAVAPTVAETDVDAVLFGAMEQGASLDFETNGRIILSSLEVDDLENIDTSDDVQYIHWQRCAGEMERESSYGEEGDEVEGVGRQDLTANNGQAVMFVEVFYEYQPLFTGFMTSEMTFRQEAAYIVRDDRNLESGLSGTDVNLCDS
jgi:hypothetical protein